MSVIQLSNIVELATTTRAWYGMENGMEISVWNMEDARMEWKISRMEWKTIFHTNSILEFVHCIHRKIHIDVG